MISLTQTKHHNPLTPSLFYYLKLFVVLRWVAISASLIAILLAQFVLHFEFAYQWLYSIIGVIAMYNGYFYFFLEGARHTGTTWSVRDSMWQRKSKQLALMQILLDLIALFFLLHFTGGLENPFVLFFLFHVVIAAILLEPKWATGLAALTSVLVFSLGILEKTTGFGHYNLAPIFGPTELNSWYYLIGVPASVTLTIIGLSFLSISIIKERQRRRRHILEMSLELDQKNRQLLRVDRMRKRLMAVASHDLKSPVGAVTSYLQNLQQGYLGPLNDKQLRVVNRSLTRLENLKAFLFDVLDWSKIERGQTKDELLSTDLGRILSQVFDDYLDVAKEKGIDLSLSLPKDAPNAKASPMRVTQVFNNLVSNAVKYTNEGKVSIEGRIEEGFWLVEIKDSGIGMDGDDLKNLFEDFYRSKHVKNKIEGTGLGLSVVKRIVDAHSGKIWAESEFGKGSTFFVKLPVSRDTIRPPVKI